MCNVKLVLSSERKHMYQMQLRRHLCFLPLHFLPRYLNILDELHTTWSEDP